MRGREQLGGQTGRHASVGQLGRQAQIGVRFTPAYTSSPVWSRSVSVRPLAATLPRSSGIRSVVVEPMSMRMPGSSGISLAAAIARASQFEAAARPG